MSYTSYPHCRNIDLVKTGENIRRIRMAKGIRVCDIRRFLGLESEQAIYKWQRGDCLPTIDNLVNLEILFGMNLDEIVVFRGGESEELSPGVFLGVLNQQLSA